MSRIRWPHAVTGASLALALLLGPTPASGQQEIRLTPRVGGLDPVGSFDQAADLGAEHYVSFDQIEGMARVGADLTLLSSSFWGVRLGASTTVGGEATGVWDCRADVCPSILLPVPSDVRVVTVTADFMITPDLGYRGRPYLLVGGGLIHHRFQWRLDPDEAIDLAPGEATRTGLGAHFGAGARWEGRRLAAEIGVEDVVAWPDRTSGGAEHAVGISAGLGLRVK